MKASSVIKEIRLPGIEHMNLQHCCGNISKEFRMTLQQLSEQQNESRSLFYAKKRTSV